MINKGLCQYKIHFPCLLLAFHNNELAFFGELCTVSNVYQHKPS